MALPSNTFAEILIGWLPALTPVTLITLAWKGRGFFDNLVTNHLTHMKQEILEAVAGSVEQEKESKVEIVKAVVDGNKDVVDTIRNGNDRIVDALITLQK